MNEKMCSEMKSVLGKVDHTLKNNVIQSEFQKSEAKNNIKDRSHQIKKIIDYLKLFGEVNQELIEDDRAKKMAGRRTTRYKISEQFL